MAERESPYLWSTTALTNGTADGSINFAEGQLPGTVNNSARSVMAAQARFLKDTNGSITSGGSANAFTLTVNGTQTAYATGQIYSFKANFSNTGASTLNVTNADGTVIGAKAIRAFVATGETALSANMIRADGHYKVQYDTAANGAAGAFILLNPAGISLTGTNSWTDTNTFTKGASTTAILVQSGSATAAGLLGLGRTGVELLFGSAGATNDLFTGVAQGESAIRGTTALTMGVASGTPVLKLGAVSVTLLQLASGFLVVDSAGLVSVENAAWGTYTPTATSAGGTAAATGTTVSTSGSYKVIGKTAFVRVNYNISVLGTASGDINLTFPPKPGGGTYAPFTTNVAGNGYIQSTDTACVVKISTVPSLQFVAGATAQSRSATFVFETT